MAKKKMSAKNGVKVRAINPLWPTMVVASAVLPLESAMASDECGAQVPGNTVVCTSAGNAYANGILYDNLTADLSLLLDTGVEVQRTPGADNDGVTVIANGYTSTVDLADGVTIEVDGADTDGLYVIGSKAITIDSGAGITAGYAAIRAHLSNSTSPDDVLVTQRQSGSLTVTADGGQGISAATDGTGSVRVWSAGRVQSNADRVFGLYAYNSNLNGGDVTTELAEDGVIILNSAGSTGLYSLSNAAGNVLATSAGTIVTTKDDAFGLYAFLGNSLSSGKVTIELHETGTVSTDGVWSNGIAALQYGLGDVLVQSSGAITTLGEGSYGIVSDLSNAVSAAEASVVLEGNGTVRTAGDGSHAIGVYNSGTGTSSVRLLGNAALSTQGLTAHGVDSASVGALTVSQAAASKVEVSGMEAFGLNLDSDTGIGVQLEGLVSASGEFAVGVAARAATGDVQQLVESAASVRGGWQSDLAGIGTTSGHQATGVLLEAGGAARLINRGAISAGSDRAVVASSGDITVDNAGRIDGFITFSGGGAAAFNNASAATFEVRHFADTDGDGMRDTKRVAISDFGSTTSVFNNAGGALVKLATVENASSTDAAGYYLPTSGSALHPLDSSVYQLGRAGVVQGQFVNLGTFNHAGVIDLRGPAIGNTLVITGAASAGGAPRNGLFVSNGGSLLINASLGSEGAQENGYADVLVVDGTQLGSAPTTITLDRKEGAGTLTPGNGILVVEVRNKAQSAANVFTLQGDYVQDGRPSVIAGAYAYSLSHNGVGSDQADGNWYLRSSMRDLVSEEPGAPDPVDPVNPVDPESPQEDAPRFQPGVPLYESYSANLQVLNALPTLQQRIGNRVWGVNAAGELTGAWGRIEGATGKARPEVSTSAARQSVDSWQMQLGMEGVLLSTDDGGRLVTSVALDYGQADSTVRSVYGDGKVRTKGYGVGTMWTWYYQGGMYVDAQAQLNLYKTDLQSGVLGRLVQNHDGRGEAFSLEVGDPIALRDGWGVTPQTQLSYSRVRFDRFEDAAGAVVSLAKADSFLSRIGMEVTRDYERKDYRSHVYGIGNFLYEWQDGLRTQVSGTELRRKEHRAWAEVGFGASFNWSNSVRLYGEFSGRSSLRDFGDSYTVHGTVGFRVRM